jgi:phosphoribosylformimino-5-aminoimidazole carboxamide ribotide isomerase
MEVIPAIDLRKGRCVRLIQGDPRDETVYSQEPVSVAKLWKLKGAKRLHVIDLDGAFTGKLGNLEYVRDIVKATDMRVQFGGGLRELKVIEKVLAAGVERVILGTSVVQNKDFVKEALSEFGGKAVLAGIDAKKGMVAIKGWRTVTKVGAVDLAKEMAQLGVGAIIFTDIQRDGMLEGPNFGSTKEIARAVGIPVIASGGMSSYRDIEHMKRLEKYGITSLILGKALYSGKIDLKVAIKMGKEPVQPTARKKR